MKNEASENWAPSSGNSMSRKAQTQRNECNGEPPNWNTVPVQMWLRAVSSIIVMNFSPQKWEGRPPHRLALDESHPYSITSTTSTTPYMVTVPADCSTHAECCFIRKANSVEVVSSSSMQESISQNNCFLKS
jgi:hypothetical protein